MPDAAGVSGAIWDADSFKLWATLLQVVDTPYEDVPILSFGDAKKAIETEIEAGHLRNIDKVQLAYAPYLDPQEKDVFWLLPVWYVKADIRGTLKRSLNRSMAPVVRLWMMALKERKLFLKLKRDELMDYNDRSAKRRVDAENCDVGFSTINIDLKKFQGGEKKTAYEKRNEAHFQ